MPDLGSDGEESAWRICERPRFNPWVWKVPWRREWQPTPGFLPGGSCGQRSLAGHSPWAHKERPTTGYSAPSLFDARSGDVGDLKHGNWGVPCYDFHFSLPSDFSLE